MQKIQERRTTIFKYPLPTCPRIRAIINKRVEAASAWKPIWNGDCVYQMKGCGK